MPSHRKMMLLTVAAASAVALACSGAAVASSAPTHTAPSHPVSSSAPNPNAPHVGFVAGVQRGTNISVRNPASVHAFRQLHAQMLGTVNKAQPQTIHEYVGSSFTNMSNSMGSQATQSVSTKIKPADPGTTLYTPTMYPSGGTAGSCIEMSTAYFHTSQVVAAWDWCKAINFVAQVTINKQFMHTYTQHKNYTTQIVQTNASKNTWTSYLYNYKTKQWQQFFQQSGTGQTGLSDGWDLYELYSNLQSNGQSYACADLQGKRVEAQNIMVDNGGTWASADPSNAGHEYDVPLSAFDCSSLTYNMITQYSHWKAVG